MMRLKVKRQKILFVILFLISSLSTGITNAEEKALFLKGAETALPESPAVVKVVQDEISSLPVIQINGKPFNIWAIEGGWSFLDRTPAMLKMVKDIIDFSVPYGCNTNFAGISWANHEPEDGKFYFDDVLETLDYARSKGLMIIFEIGSIPQWFYAKYPNSQMEGRFLDGSGSMVIPFAQFKHEGFEIEFDKFVKNLTSAIKGHPALLGYRFYPFWHGGECAYPMDFGAPEGKRYLADYSQPTQNRFLTYLKEKYGENVTDTVAPMKRTEPFFFENRQRFWDWADFRMKEFVERNLFLATTFKKYDPNHLVFIFPISDYHQGIDDGGGLGWEPYMSSKYIDGFTLVTVMGQSWFNRIPIPLCYLPPFFKTAQRYGKVVVSQADKVDASGQDISDIIRCVYSQAKIGNFGVLWFDPFVTEIEARRAKMTDKELQEIRNGKDMFFNPKIYSDNSRAKAAVIYNMETAWAYYNSELRWVAYNLYLALAESGLDFEYVTETEIKRNPGILNDYKLIIAPVVTALKSTYKALENYRRKGGNLVIIGPVFGIEHEYLPGQGISLLTGIPVKDIEDIEEKNSYTFLNKKELPEQYRILIDKLEGESIDLSSLRIDSYPIWYPDLPSGWVAVARYTGTNYPAVLTNGKVILINPAFTNNLLYQYRMSSYAKVIRQLLKNIYHYYNFPVIFEENIPLWAYENSKAIFLYNPRDQAAEITLAQDGKKMPVFIESLDSLLLKKPINETDVKKAGLKAEETPVFQIIPKGKKSITAQRAKSLIKIDGNLNDWPLKDLPEGMINKGICVVGEASGSSGRVDNDKDYSMKFYTMYDDKNLYFAAMVRDNEVITTLKGLNIWSEDCIELWFDARRDSKTTEMIQGDDFQIGLSPKSKFRHTSEKYGWRNPNPFPIITAVAVESDLTEDGYVIEAAIPLEKLVGLDIEKVNPIGFNVSGCDIDSNKGWTQIYWNGILIQDPTQFGVLYFEKSDV